MLVGALALFPASLALETWQVAFAPRFFAAFLYSVLVSGVVATMIWFVLVRPDRRRPRRDLPLPEPFPRRRHRRRVLGERVTGATSPGSRSSWPGSSRCSWRAAAAAEPQAARMPWAASQAAALARAASATRAAGQPALKSALPRPKPSAPAAHQSAKSAGPTPPTA